MSFSRENATPLEYKCSLEIALTIVTGVLSCSPTELYSALDELLDEEVPKINFFSPYFNQIKPHILERYPELKNIDAKNINKATFNAWLQSQKSKFGNFIFLDKNSIKKNKNVNPVNIFDAASLLNHHRMYMNSQNSMQPPKRILQDNGQDELSVIFNSFLMDLQCNDDRKIMHACEIVSYIAISFTANQKKLLNQTLQALLTDETCSIRKSVKHALEKINGQNVSDEIDQTYSAPKKDSSSANTPTLMLEKLSFELSTVKLEEALTEEFYSPIITLRECINLEGAIKLINENQNYQGLIANTLIRCLSLIESVKFKNDDCYAADIVTGACRIAKTHFNLIQEPYRTTLIAKLSNCLSHIHLDVHTEAFNALDYNIKNIPEETKQKLYLVALSNLTSHNPNKQIVALKMIATIADIIPKFDILKILNDSILSFLNAYFCASRRSAFECCLKLSNYLNYNDRTTLIQELKSKTINDEYKLNIAFRYYLVAANQQLDKILMLDIMPTVATAFSMFAQKDSSNINPASNEKLEKNLNTTPTSKRQH